MFHQKDGKYLSFKEQESSPNLRKNPHPGKIKRNGEFRWEEHSDNNKISEPSRHLNYLSAWKSFSQGHFFLVFLSSVFISIYGFSQAFWLNLGT